MARPERFLVALVALASSCTAFNGRTLYATDDAGGAGDAANDCGCASVTGAIACEDFEGALVEPWSLFGDVHPSTDASRAHCGKSSLHVHVPAVTPQQDFVSAVSENRTFTDGSFANGFFARAWVYVSGTIARGNYVPFFETRQENAPYLGIAAQLGASSTAISDWTSTPAAFTETSGPFPNETWTCVEWQVTFGAANGVSRLWIGPGNAPAVALETTNTQPTPPYATIFVGVYLTGATVAQPAFDLWIDDLVISGQRIGCR